VAYEPNSLGGGCPFQAGAAGFVSFPQPVEEDKVRGKPEKFAEHYLQARLFFESQTPVEQNHIIGAFRFELSKVTVPAIRERMVASLRNVSKPLAEAVAAGLGIALPDAIPKALPGPPTPEVKVSPALSMTALPGDGGIRTRKIAVLVADGVSGTTVKATVVALIEAGAVPRLVGKRLGPVTTTEKGELEAEASMENSPAVLFDALVLPGEQRAVNALLEDGHTLEFIKDQYRHCKSILIRGASVQLLERCGIPPLLPSGVADPGLIRSPEGKGEAALSSFIKAVGRHRHPERDRDPPLV